jgi:hypothetical protein
MISWTRVVVVLGIGALGILGCATIVPIATHVTQTGPNTSTDDLWIARQGGTDMMRCTNSPQGPFCVPVTMATGPVPMMMAPSPPPPPAPAVGYPPAAYPPLASPSPVAPAAAMPAPHR